MSVSSAAESSSDQAAWGAIRRYWWRSGQGTRLAVAGLSVLAGVTITGAVAFGDHGAPVQRQRGGYSAGAQRGDSFEVTVHTVSDVDTFEGMEAESGTFLRAKVAGVAPTPGCRDAESLDGARKVLYGKRVRLFVRESPSPADDRMVVDVELPGGQDYARTVVHDGVARAGGVTRSDLAAEESSARQEHRGLWAFPCTTSVPAASSPSSTQSTATPDRSSQSPPSPTVAPPVMTTTTTAWPPDDVQRDVQVGQPCAPEGARGTTIRGEDVVCARKRKGGELRWRTSNEQ